MALYWPDHLVALDIVDDSWRRPVEVLGDKDVKMHQLGSEITDFDDAESLPVYCAMDDHSQPRRFASVSSWAHEPTQM